MREELKNYIWVTPSDYAGHNPVGDYRGAGQSRDSDALERSNYRRIFEDLQAKADECWRSDSVYDFRASHWAVGWVEQIIVKADAPEPVLDLLVEIIDALEGYPVYDEEDFSALETEESEAFWDSLSIAERVELCQKAGVSIFAARGGIPHDDSGYIYEWLRG